MKRKILSCVLTICMILTMVPWTAAAESTTKELDISQGSIVITANGYTQGEGTEIEHTGEYIITQTGEGSTSNTITVNGGDPVITFKGVDIESSENSPIVANTSVTIQLLGENKIKLTGAQKSALSIKQDATVTLRVPAGMKDSDGSLIAEATARYTSAIGAGDKQVAGYLVINSGTITAKRTGSTFGEGTSIGAVRPNGIHIMQGITVNGGILNATSVNGKAMGTDSKADNIAPITINGGYVYSNTGYSSALTVNGGNVKADAGNEPTVENKDLVKLYAVDTNGEPKKNESISVIIGSNTWSTYTDEDGIITTYLAEDEEVTGGQKLPDGWLVGGTCVCDTADLTFEDTVKEVDVYSADAVVDVDVRGECKMPIHKDISVTVKVTGVTLENGTEVETDKISDYASYADGKLTVKPAGNDDNYTVELVAFRTVDDTWVKHKIKVKASNVGRVLDIANGAVSVEAAGEEGKVTYKQGSNEFTVGATDKVAITGTSSENNIEISTDATIELLDLSLTDIKAKSPIKITGDSQVTLWLKGENELISGVYNHDDGIDRLYGTTTAAIFVESGSTLIIDSEAGALKNDDIDADHYGDKQQGYAGSLLAKNTGARGGASAIGGDYFADPNMACGNITIKGGNVTAQATLASNKYASGAAIGAGYTGQIDNDGNMLISQCGNINITGGNIRALAAEGSTTPGRAISSGTGDLNITGGVIYASAPNDGWNGNSAGSIYTYSGTLTIGETDGNDSELYLYAGTTTINMNQGNNAAAAIGTSCGTLNILSGTITAESTGNGPAIGVAPYAPESEKPIKLNIAGGIVDLVLADETKAGASQAIGIGGNYRSGSLNPVEINISGGSIESNDLNIGARGNEKSTVNISNDAEVDFGNGNLAGDLNISDEADVTVGGDISGVMAVEGGTSINGVTIPDAVDTVTVPAGKAGEVKSGTTEGSLDVPAGTVVKKADGTTVTLPNGGTLKADGTIETEGSIITEKADGTVITEKPDGTVITKNPDGTVVTEYVITHGKNSVWNGSKDGLTITGNGDFDKFIGVKVDGAYIDKNHYTAKSGSTIVTLKGSYLDTLSAGNHTIELAWTDGTASTTFTIQVDKAVDSGDDMNVAIPFSIAGLALAAMAAAVATRRRYN